MLSTCFQQITYIFTFNVIHLTSKRCVICTPFHLILYNLFPTAKPPNFTTVRKILHIAYMLYDNGKCKEKYITGINTNRSKQTG